MNILNTVLNVSLASVVAAAMVYLVVTSPFILTSTIVLAGVIVGGIILFVARECFAC